jgi:glycosyltransferase involved in cell wall biosynthesis
MIHASGIGVVLDHLLRRIIARRPGWDFRLFGSPTDLARFRAGNVRIVPFMAPIYSIAEQRLGFLLAGEKCDLAWSPHYNIPLSWHGPLMVTVHDVMHLALPDMFSGWGKQSYARFMFHRVRRRAQRIAFVSQFTADEFARLLGPPQSPAAVIHNGVEASHFNRDCPRPHAKPYVLFVGNIKPNKNLRRLAEAFQRIENRVPHDLVLVGRKDGFITGDPGLARLLEANPRIRLTGSVDEARLVAFYRHADVLGMPSYYEGFGLPPLEAMAAGCPVLAARAASLPEICGDAALYCDPYDIADIAGKLVELLQNRMLQDELRIRGAARVKDFCWEKAADGYLALMDTLLDGSSLRPRG